MSVLSAMAYATFFVVFICVLFLWISFVTRKMWEDDNPKWVIGSIFGGIWLVIFLASL